MAHFIFSLQNENKKAVYSLTDLVIVMKVSPS